jgi:hypothetical protein
MQVFCQSLGLYSRVIAFVYEQATEVDWPLLSQLYPQGQVTTDILNFGESISTDSMYVLFLYLLWTDRNVE